MATEFNTRIKFKRDTSSNWTSNNPKLLNGEIILVDTDSGELRAKIGDGSKTYTQLPFSDEVVRNLIPTDLSELNQDSTHRLVTDSEKQTWNNKSDFDGNYNNLTNKPSIPTVSTSVTSTSTTTAASSSAVKQAYDKATAAMPKTGGTFTGSVTSFISLNPFENVFRTSYLFTADEVADFGDLSSGVLFPGHILWVYE